LILVGVLLTASGARAVTHPSRVGVPDINLDPCSGHLYCASISITGTGQVTVTGFGSGATCSSSCRFGYDPEICLTTTATCGYILTFTASPAAGYTFAPWGGACASAGTGTCTLPASQDYTVVATFSPTPTQSTKQLTVQRIGSGGGAVTSNPPGIDCGGTCSAAFDSRATVTLTATPYPGSIFDHWSGECSGNSTCSVVTNSDKTITADFEQQASTPPPPPSAPVIGDASAPPEKPLYPPPAASLAVSVAGNGSIVTTGHSMQSADDAATIQCGLAGFNCYATTTPGATVTLRAKPGYGAVFKRWKGACAAAGATCQVALSASQSVTAVFAPAHGSALAATLARPTLHISWKQSVGRGTLLVSGQLTKPALLSVQLRRPHGGPLLTESTTVAAGRFTHVTRLFPGVLARGARLFPGGMMVVLTGRSGDLPLPFLLQTIVIPSPPEGVTRKVFASSTATSPPARSLPAGSTEAWAHFVFQNQPVRQRRLTVSWYWPNGHLLGTIVKANRPSLDSFLKSSAALPSGGWRAELRAGGKVVSELRIRIG
jgi:hypothetical protein